MSVLQLLLWAALGIFVYRASFNRSGGGRSGGPRFRFPRREMTHYEKLRSVEPGPFAKKSDDQRGG